MAVNPLHEPEGKVVYVAINPYSNHSMSVIYPMWLAMQYATLSMHLLPYHGNH